MLMELPASLPLRLHVYDSICEPEKLVEANELVELKYYRNVLSSCIITIH